MLFRDIIGQETIKRDLVETVANNRVAHAYLFTGPEGSGKLPLALGYAQYLNCTNPQNGDSCGECPTCKAFAKLTHPDLHFIFPFVKNKEKDKLCCDDYLTEWRELFAQNPYISLEMWQNYIGFDNKQPIIYESEAGGDENEKRLQNYGLTRRLAYSNYNAKYKVLIIWMAEKMNSVFANKILKILEEPNPNTIFLLITENLQNLLPTIVSRTQIIRVPKIDEQSLATRLEIELGISGDELQSYVKNSNGNYIRAIQMFASQDSPSQNFDLFTKIMRYSWKPDVLSFNNLLDDIDKMGRERQKSFLNYCLREIRENFIRNLDEQSLLYMDNQEAAFSEKFHPFINELNVQQFYNEINKAYRHIERNGNAKIIFFDLFIKFAVLIKKAKIDK